MLKRIFNTFKSINELNYYSVNNEVPAAGTIVLAVNFTNIVFFINNNFFSIEKLAKKNYLLYLDGWYSKWFITKKIQHFPGYNILCNIIDGASKRNIKLHFIVPRIEDLKELDLVLLGRVKFRASVWRFNNIPLDNDVELFFHSKDVRLQDDEVIIFGIGSGIQEHVAKIWKFNNTIYCIGAALDFYIGKQSRAPILFRKYKLEWVYRFLLNPKKMARRVFIDPFMVIFYYIIYLWI